MNINSIMEKIQKSVDNAIENKKNKSVVLSSGLGLASGSTGLQV